MDYNNGLVKDGDACPPSKSMNRVVDEEKHLNYMAAFPSYSTVFGPALERLLYTAVNRYWGLRFGKMLLDNASSLSYWQ